MYSAEEIIKLETRPALGCTEPAAVALNAAFINSGANSVKRIKLEINANLAKNAMYVLIPNTGGRYGIKLAFALGLVCGNKNYGLEIFKDVNDECLKKALILEKLIDLHISDGSEIYIKSEVKTDKDVLVCVTEKYHDGVSYVEINGKKEYLNKKHSKNSELEAMEEWFKSAEFEKIFELVENMTDFEAVKQSIDMNMILAQYGLKHRCGLGIGYKSMGEDILSKIKAYTAAASDARMEGVNLNAMSVTGSGNHGIAATLPVYVFGKEKNYSNEDIYKSTALSMLVTTYIKLYTKRLSPLCGAAFAGGCGSCAGITYLETKNIQKVKKAVKFNIQLLMGIICEGAKTGCSLKVLSAAENAYNSYLFAVKNTEVYEDGILEESMKKTFENVGAVSESMMPVDTAVIDIMKKKIIQEV